MRFHEIFKKITKKFSENNLPSLIQKGLKIGDDVFIGSDVFVDPVFPWLITIADQCTITDRVIILAHDASTKRHIGYTKIGRVSIGRKTFIGMGSIILPGVIIGDNVIIAAGSVVTKNVSDNSIVAGNPAITIGSTTDYIRHHKQNMNSRPVFSHGSNLESELTEENKKIMNESLSDGIGYHI